MRKQEPVASTMRGRIHTGWDSKLYMGCPCDEDCFLHKAHMKLRLNHLLAQLFEDPSTALQHINYEHRMLRHDWCQSHKRLEMSMIRFKIGTLARCTHEYRVARYTGDDRLA